MPTMPALNPVASIPLDPEGQKKIRPLIGDLLMKVHTYVEHSSLSAEEIAAATATVAAVTGLILDTSEKELIARLMTAYEHERPRIEKYRQ